MGRPRKTPLNGDSKLIIDAIVKLRDDITGMMTEVASEKATRSEQHSSNLRSLESMSGDMHIVLSKVQDLPCKGEAQRINSNEKNIRWLMGILSAVIIAVIITFIKG